MPILEVELVRAPDEVVAPELAATLADAAGRVFETGPGRTWVRLRTLEAQHYAENGGTGARPVFVSVLLADALPRETRALKARELADVVGAACNRAADRVHVLFEPSARGRIAFGGELLGD